MTTLEILTAARAKVAQGWTQGTLARGVSGHDTHPKTDAVCWCAEGAIVAVSSTRGNSAFEVLRRSLPDNYITTAVFNDTPGRTQAEVLALFDRAIALATSDERAEGRT